MTKDDARKEQQTLRSPHRATPELPLVSSSQQAPHHVRSDSSFSMDSFVMDVVSNTNIGSGSNNNNNSTGSILDTIAVRDDHTAIYDAAMTHREGGSSHVYHSSDSGPVSSTPPSHSTIDRGRSDSGLWSGDDSSVQPSPVHPFFHSLQHSGNDSDGHSDGSIIFNNPSKSSHQPVVPQMEQQQPAGVKIGRDRFPSYDSTGSSGSVVKRAIPSAISRAPNVPTNEGGILPYHERRKLLQQRQKQQQQLQMHPQQPFFTSPSRDQTPPRPELYPQRSQPAGYPLAAPFTMRTVQSAVGSNTSHLMQSHEKQHISNNTPQMNYEPFLYQPQQANQQQPPLFPPIYAYQPPSDMMLPTQSFEYASDYRDVLDIRQVEQKAQQPYLYEQSFEYASRMDGDSHAFESRMLSNAPTNNRGLPLSSPQSHPPGPYNGPPVSQSLPLGHVVSTCVGAEMGDQWQASSSFDSSDALEHLNRTKVYNHGIVVTKADAADHRRKKIPPPPPPPPPIPPSLVRQDSVGSVSSLGSVDRSGRADVAKGQQPKHGVGFFERLNPWASPPKQHNLGDFHRNNQAFLSKIERITTPKYSTPEQTARRAPSNSTIRMPLRKETRRRLNSIENDDWSESDANDGTSGDAAMDERRDRNPSHHRHQKRRSTALRNQSKAIHVDASENSNPEDVFSNERTSLLPPSGISTNEYADRLQHYRRRPDATGSNHSLNRMRQSEPSIPRVSTRHETHVGTSRHQLEHEIGAVLPTHPVHLHQPRRLRTKKKNRRPLKMNRWRSSDDSSMSSSTSEVGVSPREFIGSSPTPFIWSFFDRDHTGNVVKYGECRPGTSPNVKLGVTFRFFTRIESFFANLPLTIGAIALSIASLGVVWFKFAEENMHSCIPVHFHSAQCTFPEFPGCFYCDTSARMYKVAANFHFGCSLFAGLLAFSFIAKLILARQVVFSELSSPTTASPAGLLFMTLDVVFAGRGFIGMLVVSCSSFAHLCIAIWFLYLAMAYHSMPEPSWFPSTSGLGVSAVKTYLYFPVAGHFLMAVSLSLTFVFFPISLIRVYFNKKISATVGWMQMSAPNVALYAVTIMAQPSFEEENPDINNFQRIHRHYYLPFMTFLFGLCMLGAVASVHSLVVRWNDFRKLHFSPAHAAFCAPSLSHCNAVQAFRAAVLSFSGLPTNSAGLKLLYMYWLVVLVTSTCATLFISTMYLASLPKWTYFDLNDEVEPPAPNETAMSLSHMISSGETLLQPFVSPAILQANETGTLVLTRGADGHVRYTRTRKVTALGFEPIMDDIEIDLEREFLLDWVGKNAPRRRHKTLSVPGMACNVPFGSGNYGVYGGMEEGEVSVSRRRHESHILRRGKSLTSSPYYRKTSK